MTRAPSTLCAIGADGVDIAQLLRDGGESSMSACPLPEDFDAEEPLWDLRDGAGRLLLVGVTHHAAWLATEQLRQIPGWVASARQVIYICCQTEPRRPGLLWDWRHEGPLELVASADGVARVMARSHVGLCSIPLEEAMRRLDQFSAADQAVLLSGLPCTVGEINGVHHG